MIFTIIELWHYLIESHPVALVRLLGLKAIVETYHNAL